MNTRDFCFWLQGYCEITENELPNLTQLKMIAEHLALARQDVYEGSVFCKFTDVLQGFFDINGLDDLSAEHWENITTRLQELFTKVTSTQEELKDNEPTTEELIREAIERMRKDRTNPETIPYIPPFIPPQPNPWEPLNPYSPGDPWKLPEIICSPNTSEGDPNKFMPNTLCEVKSSDAFCASGNSTKFDDSLTKACMSLESAYDRVTMDDEKLG